MSEIIMKLSTNSKHRALNSSKTADLLSKISCNFVSAYLNLQKKKSVERSMHFYEFS